MSDEVPEGWERVTVLDLSIKSRSGGTPISTNEEYYKGTIPFVVIEDITSSGKYIRDAKKHITEAAVESCSTWIVPRESILYTMYATFGEVAINKVEVATNQAILCIIPNSGKIDTEFFFYVLSWFKQFISNYTFQTTQSNLNAHIVRDFCLLIPMSLFEQRKITSILQGVDNAIDKTKELIEKHEKIKQGLMHDLFTNGVDEQGVQYSQTKEHSLFGKMPAHWREGLMRYICDVSQGLQIAITERKTRPGRNRYVYITIQYLNAEDKVKSAEFIENPPKSVICSEEDVLMTRTGNTGQVITGYSGVFHNNFFIVKYNKSKAIKKYLVYYLQRPEIRNLMTSLAGLTTIPDLKHADFLNMPMIYPEDLNEQERIAQILGSIENRIQSEQNYLDKLTKIKKGLMQDLLTGRVRVAA